MCINKLQALIALIHSTLVPYFKFEGLKNTKIEDYGHFIEEDKFITAGPFYKETVIPKSRSFARVSSFSDIFDY